MAKKIKLDIDFTEDNYLLGVSCHKKDYFLAFRLNENLNLDFRRLQDFPFYNLKLEKLIPYTFFHYHHHENLLGYYLISNYNPESKLFAEFSSIDYFILIQGRLSEEMKKDHLTAIKKISGVLTAYSIESKKLKEYDNFLSDLELHITHVLKDKN